MIAVVENALKSNSQAEALKAVAMYDDWWIHNFELGSERRKACVKKHLVFLKSIGAKKGKGMNLRREFASWVYCGAREFKTEEEEYQYVENCPIKNSNLRNCFDENEYERVIQIVRDYGYYDQ